MKIQIENGLLIYNITDDSNECDHDTYFLKTKQNQRYIEKALEKNPKGLLDPMECLGLLHVKEKIKIISITGTNGKTTTAAALYSMLLDLDKKVAMQGTRGCFINEKRVAEKSLTTPALLQTIKNIQEALKEECEYFVMEVSSHAIEQKRIEGLDFTLKILTNITQDHLDYHGNLENYCAVKSSFFEDESKKLINKDEKKIRFNKTNCMTYGLENPATYKVAAYSLKDGLCVAVQNIDKVFDFASSMHGLFNVYNLLAAVSALDMLGVASIEDICRVVENFGGVEGRMEVVSENPLVIVDFAHTPDGMEKVLESLKDKDMIVVFGAGGDRDKTKRPLMGRVANRYAKKVIITSDNPRSEEPEDIITDILSGIKMHDGLHVEADREKAIKLALHIRQNDEMVLILGKGDETYQEIKGKKFDFDDRTIVKNILQNTPN